MSWTILQYKPNAHKLAEANLIRQGFETFLPFEEITKYQNKQYINTMQPLFPGYMFVKFESKKTLWHKINNTIGVSKLLTLNNLPCVVPDNLITNIKTRCNKARVLVPKNQFSKDDNVRIVSGPFDNFLATIECIEKNQRVWILMDLMGQEIRTMIDTKKLEHNIKSTKNMKYKVNY